MVVSQLVITSSSERECVFCSCKRLQTKKVNNFTFVELLLVYSRPLGTDHFLDHVDSEHVERISERACHDDVVSVSFCLFSLLVVSADASSMILLHTGESMVVHPRCCFGYKAKIWRESFQVSARYDGIKLKILD